MKSSNCERAIALLQEVTGDSYELVGLLRGGETGAHELRRGDHAVAPEPGGAADADDLFGRLRIHSSILGEPRVAVQPIH